MLIIDMPMPIVCADCPICICLNGMKPAYCKAVLVDDDNIVDGTMWKETDPNAIPNWCPIKGGLVRCDECKHRDPEDKRCDCGGHEWMKGKILPVEDDWFCADGERKDGEND